NRERILATAEPGSGKSWVGDQLRALRRDDLQTSGEAPDGNNQFDRTRGVLDNYCFPRSGNAACATSLPSHCKPTSRNSLPAPQSRCCPMSRGTRSVTCFPVLCVSLCSTICW